MEIWKHGNMRNILLLLHPMLNILQNTDEVLHIKSDDVIIDQFTHFSGTKKISLAKNTTTYYLII